MRRLTAMATASFLAIALAGPVSAHGAAEHHASRGFLPPRAEVHGHTLRQLATAWSIWAFGSPAAVNPLLANRCEQSSIDPKVWFLPVSLGGDYAVDCAVPYGSLLVVTPGGYECSTAEGNGTTPAELRACTRAGFDLITRIELSLDGRPVPHLDRYVLTTRLVNLPGPNLLGSGATPSVMKGYFLVTKPMRPGSHTMRAYDEFASIGLTAGITYNITVGPPPVHHGDH